MYLKISLEIELFFPPARHLDYTSLSVTRMERKNVPPTTTRCMLLFENKVYVIRRRLAAARNNTARNTHQALLSFLVLDDGVGEHRRQLFVDDE